MRIASLERPASGALSAAGRGVTRTFERRVHPLQRNLVFGVAAIVITASVLATLLVSAAFLVSIAAVAHLVSSTLFLRKGSMGPPALAWTYWLGSNLLLFGLAIWGLVSVRGVLFL